MREILFRGKRIDNSKWVEGEMLHDMQDRPHIYWKTPKELPIVFSNHAIVDPATLGQFTGLTDKNGKKIFEGDIVRDAQSSLFGKVIYATPQDGFDGIAGFMVDDIDDGLQNYNGFWHQVEVVGNIHDNPELLGVTDNA